MVGEPVSIRYRMFGFWRPVFFSKRDEGRTSNTGSFRWTREQEAVEILGEPGFEKPNAISERFAKECACGAKTNIVLGGADPPSLLNSDSLQRLTNPHQRGLLQHFNSLLGNNRPVINRRGRRPRPTRHPFRCPLLQEARCRYRAEGLPLCPIRIGWWAPGPQRSVQPLDLSRLANRY